MPAAGRQPHALLPAPHPPRLRQVPSPFRSRMKSLTMGLRRGASTLVTSWEAHSAAALGLGIEETGRQFNTSPATRAWALGGGTVKAGIQALLASKLNDLFYDDSVDPLKFNVRRLL